MMLVNILHRPEPGERFQLFLMEQEMCHNLGLKTTILVTPMVLQDPQLCHQIAESCAKHGDEIGLSFHGLNRAYGREAAGYGMDAFWLYSKADKLRIAQQMGDDFTRVFGFEPASAAAYHFDSSSLEVLEATLPSVKTVVAGCFEEGVRVFHGCNNSWYLFNEGMPWGPWYPSRSHSLRPAADRDDAFDVVAIPHLVRDMALSYEGRNDFWASHPPNVIRAMGNMGTECPYDRNLVDMFRFQERYNGGFSYYTTFVSPSWLTWNHNSEYPPSVAQTLYLNQLKYFAELQTGGKLSTLTMSEFGAWYRDEKQFGAPEVYFAKELIYGSGKHYFWFADAGMRALLDANQGGSIGDLRPYVARVAGATGPDTEQLQIGTYPYLIQSQHRTGALHHYEDGSRTSLLFRRGEECLDLAQSACRIDSVVRKDDGTCVLGLSEAHLKFTDGHWINVKTSVTFFPGARISFVREIELDPSLGKGEVELEERFKGCFGYTEYPAPLAGIVLRAGGDELLYAYQGRKLHQQKTNLATAKLPNIGCEIEWQSVSPGEWNAEAIEGHLFNPYYTLSLKQSLNATTRTEVWMTMRST